jgi:putative endopeptidase
MHICSSHHQLPLTSLRARQATDAGSVSPAQGVPAGTPTEQFVPSEEPSALTLPALWTSQAPPAAGVSAAGERASAPDVQATAAEVPSGRQVTSGFDPANLDRTTSPTEDFYQFAMGSYLASRPIPADRERFGVDAEITIRNDQTVKEILSELAAEAGHAPGSIEQKLGDFFKSGMDAEAIERAGLSPLRADLEAIDAISSKAELNQAVQRFHAEGNSVYFSFYGTTDAKDANRVIGEFGQGGLSLPEPEYYTSEENKETLAQFEAHVARMFELSGIPSEQARQDARSVVELESRLAQVSLSAVDLRDPEKLYNLRSLEQISTLSDAFDWSSYLTSQKVEPQPTYNVSTLGFFEKLGQIKDEMPLEAHKAYLRWHLLHANASELPEAFDQEHFDFYARTLQGVPEQKPRVDRVADAADSILGEALGVKFVERRFSPEAKAKMEGMVEAFKEALAEKIQSLSWMGPETREAALEKLSTFKAKIGYPDKPQTYEQLEIVPDSYIENTRNAARYNRGRNMAEIGKPVDKEAWLMSASTNNAYYNPTTNEICFPAGILQPPYFDVDADEAINFGGIGATIGHELGHGFDDEGAQFDAQGNLRNWFAPEDLEKFKQKAEGVERQFSEYVVEGLPVNGKLVLGEALADLSGLELAYAAFKKATADRTPEMIDGFTPDQRFFLAFAQSWATNVRPEYAKLMVKSDPHPLPKLRVNGTLSNMTEFFDAFGVRPGQPMRRPEEKRNEIWR